MWLYKLTRQANKRNRISNFKFKSHEREREQIIARAFDFVSSSLLLSHFRLQCRLPEEEALRELGQSRRNRSRSQHRKQNFRTIWISMFRGPFSYFFFFVSSGFGEIVTRDCVSVLIVQWSQRNHVGVAANQRESAWGWPEEKGRKHLQVIYLSPVRLWNV